MPTRKVKGGYRYGKRGKVYPTKAQADRQGRAIRASRRRREASGYSDRRQCNAPAGRCVGVVLHCTSLGTCNTIQHGAGCNGEARHVGV